MTHMPKTYIIQILDCVTLFEVKLEGLDRCSSIFLAPAKSLVLRSRWIFYCLGQNSLDPDEGYLREVLGARLYFETALNTL